VVRGFIAFRFADRAPDWGLLSPADPRGYVVDVVNRRDGRPSGETVVGVRSLLRYLIFLGVIGEEYLTAIPPTRRWRLASLPRYISREDVRRVLDACSGATRVEVRDKAILLLLASAAMRGGEVARLDLDDVDWRRGSFLVRTPKNHRQRCLPLAEDTGRAIIAYLKQARPRVSSRAMFLTDVVPHRRIKAAHVSEIAAIYMKRANVVASHLGAHALRHTAATEMVRGGATFKEVADVLGHRNLATTQVYAKLDLPSLAAVAMPWPGGVR
jgi:site-specific recombinase XerD